MTWQELGEGLAAVRDGHDLPHRVAEGLLGLGYIVPGTAANEFRPTLTENGQKWLGRLRGDVEVELAKLHHLNQTLALIESAMFRQPDPRD